MKLAILTVEGGKAKIHARPEQVSFVLDDDADAGSTVCFSNGEKVQVGGNGPDVDAVLTAASDDTQKRILNQLQPLITFLAQAVAELEDRIAALEKDRPSTDTAPVT